MWISATQCEIRFVLGDPEQKFFELGPGCTAAQAERQARTAEELGYSRRPADPDASLVCAAPDPTMGPPVVEFGSLDVVSREMPRYPRVVGEPADQGCEAQVIVGVDGVPEGVLKITGCDQVFHGPTCAALMGWRWEEPRQAGVPVRARVHVTMRFTQQTLPL